MKNLQRITLVFAALSLTACSGLGDALGLGRNPPDEFAVVERPPLAVPPDFSLRPPKPGEPRPQEDNLKQKAASTLFGTGQASRNFMARGAEDSGLTDSERALLDAAGSNKADPSIRAQIDREAGSRVAGSDRLVDHLLWWKSTEAPATTVDAAAEAERLKEAAAKGEPVNKGATPVIERKKSGFLGL